jgi:hypothetical protein
MFVDHLFHQAEGELAILDRFPGETEDKVYVGHETGLPYLAGGCQGLFRRMPSPEPGKEEIAAGLGPEDNGFVPAKSLHQLQNFRMNPIRADFRWKASEMDSPDPRLATGAQKFFDGG